MFKFELTDIVVMNFLNQIPIEELIKRVESKGYSVVSSEDTSKYVNIDKSMGTEPFYDMLVEAVEKGELNLELLVGKVAVNKIMSQSRVPQK